MKIAIATANRHKIEEIRHKLADIDSFELISAHELARIGEIEENGSTFEENALIKAREVCRITGLVSLADDSGLEVDALGGEPGIYSARYGDRANDQERYELLLSKLASVPVEKRSARFVCVIALAYPDGHEITLRGECEGFIATAPSGDRGFGYDPVFLLSDRSRSFAELSMDEKNRISHRARALEKFHDYIAQEGSRV